MNTSRRHFLHAASGLAAAGSSLGMRLGTPFTMGLAGLGALAADRARAADTGGAYKALVCLFMNGGNDSHNWVVPVDATGYAEYTNARRELAWPANRLLAINSTTQGSGRSFALAQELQPLHAMYQAGRCAVVANVGTLTRPVTKADFNAGRNLPPKLFSHNDQQSTWQSLQPEGAPSGWGGRMGDLLMAGNQNPTFTAVSGGGNAVFLTGSHVTQYQVSTSGPVAVNALGSSSVFGSASAITALRRNLLAGGSNDFQAEYARVMKRSVETSANLRTAMAATAVQALPNQSIGLPGGGSINLNNESLAQQLRTVAQMVAAASGLGMQRQVFMVNIGGFDTHANQMRDQPYLMARVAQSVGWFFTALDSLGLSNNVTLFTASDFGRTLSSNGQGSDHGWGSHHFVAGGAVNGGQIYGRFPVTAVDTADEVGSGRLLPSTSVTEYAATLGRWMGLNSTELASVLPGLGNFASPNLGFV
jgi:uncharacterized protein (DUF1501 family)